MAIYFGITIAEKLTQADAYFAEGNHMNAHDWAKFSDDDKEAGLLQAEREIDLYLAICLETSYDSTSWPVDGQPNFRPDYAVFEQAFYLFRRTARTSDSSDGQILIKSGDYQKHERNNGVGLSPQATRFLRLNRLQIVRG